MNDTARKDLAEAMEAAIDAMSLSDVLDVLSSICGEKAEHVRSNWQDEPLAKTWERAARAIDKAAVNINPL